MGGFDIGGLSSFLNLDDSQFTAAVNRAGGAARLLTVDINKVGDGLSPLLEQFKKAGYSIDPLIKGLTDATGRSVSLMDAARQLAGQLKEVQDRLVAMSKVDTTATELENYRAMLVAEELRLGKLREEYKAMQDMIALTSRLRAAEDAGIRATLSGLEQERQIRLNGKESEFKSAQDYSNLVKQLQQREVDGAKQVADEKVRLANQYAQGVYRASQIELEQQRQLELAERRRFEQHRQLNQIASGLTTIGLGVGAAGAVGLAGELGVAHEAATFQDAMAKSLVVIGEVSTALQDQLAKSAREAAKATGLSAVDIAADFAIMKKGGLDAAESIRLVGMFSQFAVANQVPLHDSTKQLLTVMEAFGLQASDLPRIANELTRGAQLSRSSVDQLATSLEGRAGSALKAAKVSLEESIALTVAFAKRGYEASAAQTALSQIINRVTALAHTHGQVMLEVNGEYKSFHDLVYGADGSVRPFLSTLSDLNAAFSGASAEAIRKFFDEIKMGTTRGVDAVRAVVSVAPEITNLTADIANSSKVMGKAFTDQLKSPLVQLELLKRQLDDVAITIGTPVVGALLSMGKALTPVLDLVVTLTREFAKLPTPVQEFIALAGLVGSTGLIAGGGLLTMAGGVVRLYSDLRLLQQAGALTNMLTMFTGIATKAGIITAAIIAMGIATAELIKLGDEQIKNRHLTGPGSTGDQVAKDEAEEIARKLAAKKSDEEAKQKKLSISTDPAAEEKARAALVAQEAALSEAQTALNKFADSYNSNFQLLSADQRAFLESSFSGLNDILGKGTATKNLSTFKAKLGEYSQALHEFTAQAKEELANEKLSESVSKMSDKLSREGAVLSGYEEGFFRNWLSVIDGLVTKGLDPRLIDPQITAFNDKLSNSLSIGVALRAEGKALGTELERAFALTAAQVKETDKAFEHMLVTVSVVDRLKSMGRSDIASALQDNSRAAFIGRTMGFGKDSQAGLFQNMALEMAGLNVPLIEKQKALIAMWEEMSRVSGDSAESISQSQKVMINGVVQDYDALKDRVKSNLGAVAQTWRDIIGGIQGAVSKFVGGLGGSLFDTLFPNFTNPQSNDPLKPLVDSFRSAFEQLSAYSNPKQALKDLIASIQKAGTASQANAIAVKYFGTTAGPLLASELRNGTISAKDLAAAIDAASVSTQDYAKQTTTATSQITLLWRQLVKDVVVAIAEELIKLGLLQILIWIGLVNKSTNTLASGLDQVFTRLARKLWDLFRNLGVQITGIIKETVKNVEDVINNMHATATVEIQTIYSSIGTPGGGYGGDGADLFSNLYNAYNYQYNNPFSGMNGSGGSAGVFGGGNPGDPLAGAIGVSEGAFSVTGPITVVANDPTTFVRKLKALRVVKGMK